MESSEGAGLAEEQTAGEVMHLTRRERQVLRGIALGLCSKEIGVKYGISYKTVSRHRQNLMAKLNVHTIAPLVHYALNKRMVTNFYK